MLSLPRVRALNGTATKLSNINRHTIRRWLWVAFKLFCAPLKWLWKYPQWVGNWCANQIRYTPSNAWSHLRFFFRYTRTRKNFIFIPIVLPFVLWAWIGAGFAGFGLVFDLPEIEPWFPGVALRQYEVWPRSFFADKCLSANTPISGNGTSAPQEESTFPSFTNREATDSSLRGSTLMQSKDLTVRWWIGLTLVVLHIAFFFIIIWIILPFRRISYLKLKRQLEAIYKNALQRRNNVSKNIAVTFRHIHFRKRNASGLKPFFKDFTDAQKYSTSATIYGDGSPGRFSQIDSHDLLCQIVKRFHTREATVFLGLIDGDITKKRRKNQSERHEVFLLLYFLLLDCQSEPSNVMSRIFSYRRTLLSSDPAQSSPPISSSKAQLSNIKPTYQLAVNDKDFLARMLLANVLSGTTTYLHLFDCTPCINCNTTVCNKCKSDPSRPLTSLDYVCVPRSRISDKGAATVFFDFENTGFTLSDGVFVDVIKRDFECRLTQTDYQVPIRVTIASLSEPDPAERFLGSVFTKSELLEALESLKLLLAECCCASRDPVVDTTKSIIWKHWNKLSQAIRKGKSEPFDDRIELANLARVYKRRCTILAAALNTGFKIGCKGL